MTRGLPLACLLAAAIATRTLAAQSPATWHLQLDHAVRPAEGTAGVLGDVSSIAVTRAGVVYVAEQKVPRVTRYDASGKFSAIMRSGAGPGEVRSPVIALLSDTLVVFDPTLTRLTRISPAGAIIGSQPFGDPSGGVRSMFTLPNGTVLIEGGYRIPGMRSSALRLVPNGRVDTIAWNDRFEDNQWKTWEYPGGMIKGGPFNVAPHAAFDPAGHVVFGGSRASRWYVVSGKDTVQRVALADHPVTIPKAIRDSAWNAFMAAVKNLPGAVAGLKKESLATTYAAWLSIDINPRGEWWIGRPGTDGTVGSWDVVRDGKLVAHVAAPARVAGAKAIGGDLVALLHEDENAVPWIGVYRIVRGK